MFSYVWYVILTLCSIAWMTWVVVSNRRRVDPPLPPGPMGLPVVGSLPFLDPELHSYFANLAKTYGPLFTLRLGKKNVIVANSPSTAKEILKDYDLTFANRDVPAAAKVASYGGFDVAWSPYGPQWRMLRKVFVREMLGPRTLDAVYKLGKQEIEQTMHKLKEQSTSNVNIGQAMFDTMMNVVMSMLWGGTIKGEQKAALVNDFRVAQAELMSLMGAPNVSDFFPTLERFDLQGIVKKAKVCAKTMDDIIEAVINRAQKLDKNDNVSDQGGKDFIKVLLELKDIEKDSNMAFTMTHLKALLADIVVGGTDTTSNTLEFAMAEIMNNPRVMRRAQQELDTITGSIVNAPLDESQICQLPYLQAIMKETLRLHPIVPLLVPRCPTQSCIVKGHTVLKGSRVFVNVWAIHRDPSVWEDPLEFKPERFLDGKPDFRGNYFGYLPFGSGRRICVGVAMAERMVMYSLASMLHYFDWNLPQGVDKVDLDEKFGITLKLRMPLFLVPSPRSSRMYIESDS